MTAEQFIERNQPVTIFNMNLLLARLNLIINREQANIERAIGITFDSLDTANQAIFDDFMHDLIWGNLIYPADFATQRDLILLDAIEVLALDDIEERFGGL